MKNFFQSKLFKVIILGTTGLVILVLVFGLGVYVGARRADYSFKWADEYHRNFGGPEGGFFGDLFGSERELPNANGSFGQIIKIDSSSNTLTIKDVSNIEKDILLSNKTTIMYQRKTIKLSDLKLNDSVVVIGDPNSSGQIVAELIRVMPQKPTTQTPPLTPTTPPPGYNY